MALGTGKNSPYFLLKCCAISWASSRCRTWSSPTGTCVDLLIKDRYRKLSKALQFCWNVTQDCHSFCHDWGPDWAKHSVPARHRCYGNNIPNWLYPRMSLLFVLSWSTFPRAKIALRENIHGKDTNKRKLLNSAQRKFFVISPAVSLEIKEHALQCASKVGKICKA